MVYCKDICRDNINLSKTYALPAGIADSAVINLVGTEPSNPSHPNLTEFAISVAKLSPHTIAEIMELEEPQYERLLEAYELVKMTLKELGIFPVSDRDRQLLARLDDTVSGYPMMKLSHLYDAVATFAAKVGKTTVESYASLEFNRPEHIITISDLAQRYKNQPNLPSWMKLQGKFRKLMRLKVFDIAGIPEIDWDRLLQAGKVVVIDLADNFNKAVSNIAISQILSDLRNVQERRYDFSRKGGTFLVPVEVFIEGAHHFLRRGKTSRMELVMTQMNEMILRGRKRKLGVCLITQFPEHIPNDLLGSMHSAIIHRITDPNTIKELERSVYGVAGLSMVSRGRFAGGLSISGVPRAIEYAGSGRDAPMSFQDNHTIVQ